MLTELAVHDLGVISDLTLGIGPGMTALTGETGAGKTLLVEALDLLVGGRADTQLVRPGATEALVEGRFELDGTERILARSVASAGRSRAWIDGRMAPVSALGSLGRDLVDLHGQHSHQSLLRQEAQRAVLDSFAGLDAGEVSALRSELRALDAALAELGGDDEARQREIQLLGFQIDELVAAHLGGEDEDEHLAAEEERLARAGSHREACMAALATLAADSDGAIETVGLAVGSLSGHLPLADSEGRLRAVEDELSEVASELRRALESLEDDPERLEEVIARRRLLADLRRKYGPSHAEVVAFARRAEERLLEIQSLEGRARSLQGDRADTASRLSAAEARLGEARRAAAPGLASAVEAHLRTLALPAARFVVDVGERDPGDQVTFSLGPNPGEPCLPLARVASGGELARTMLATRLVGDVGPATLVFDEVDAGIGGEAALAVGAALASLAEERQVLVVTHLPQVAAFADRQVLVTKAESDGRTVAVARPLEPADRVVELSRMLSGQPQSTTARDHAEELLEVAARQRGR
jgi:DNA repair protein RecN (Recombination protein N)